MTCIIFKLRAELPDQAQDRLLQSIAEWDCQNRAGRLNLAGSSPEKRTLCYVYVADDNSVPTILKRLQGTSEVEYAHIPARRQVAEVSH